LSSASRRVLTLLPSSGLTSVLNPIIQSAEFSDSTGIAAGVGAPEDRAHPGPLSLGQIGENVPSLMDLAALDAGGAPMRKSRHASRKSWPS
jgi:hypothetical protein